MPQTRLEYLYQLCMAARANPEEQQEMITLLTRPENETAARELLNKAYNEVRDLTDVSPEIASSILQAILSSGEKRAEISIATSQPLHVYSFRKSWWAAAAAIVILFGSGTAYYLWNRQHVVQLAKQPAMGQDISAPTTNRATITLANGNKLFLDSATAGELALQGDVKVEKLANGEIKYNSKQPGDNVSIDKKQNSQFLYDTYNTLTNPRGSKVIDITLSDGTQVWLNAESSLKYPVAFAGSERKVEITGEGYFEVAHNSKQPFIVSKNNVSVTVLGTHFNVNAYDDDESIKVTLLEGSVEVTAKNDKTATGGNTTPDNKNTAAAGTTAASTRRLSPGEQAMVQAGRIALKANPDIDQVMAWKNGLFNFQDADIKTVMRQLSRWYDVDVRYDGEPATRHFSGEIGRGLTLTQLLTGLASTQVHFKIEGKTITMMR